jgi:twinkle protein
VILIQVVVVTEGEFDAMAVHEVTGFPAVSLPNGASSLPTQLVDYLEKVERVYLWMDNDEAGMLNLENFANKLGVKRTFIVKTDPDGRLK